MSTIKNLLQSFCYRLNLPAPTSFVGVSSPSERQYLELLRYIGDNLRNRPFAWPQLKRVHNFTTSTGVGKYRLPGDFYRLLDSTQWDTTNSFSMIGPASDGYLAARKYAAINVVTRKVYQINGPIGHLYSTAPYSRRSSGYFEIEPAGQNNTDILTLGYLSCNWVQPIDWVASTAYTAGQVRSVDGYVYICTGNGTSGTTRPSDGTVDTDITDGTVTWRVYTEPYHCSHDNSLLTDNDLVLFDQDAIIDGMVWRYKQLKGLDFMELRAEWENQISAACGRFKGITRANMADHFDDALDEWPNMPLGNWNV